MPVYYLLIIIIITALGDTSVSDATVNNY